MRVAPPPPSLSSQSSLFSTRRQLETYPRRVEHKVSERWRRWSGCGGQETPSSPSASSPLPVGFSKVNNAESISLRIVENVRGSRGPSGPPPPSTVQKVEAQSGSKLSVLPQSTWFVCGRWDLAPRFPDPGPGSDHHLTWPLVYPFNLETVAVDTRLSGSFRQLRERVLLRTGHG